MRIALFVSVLMMDTMGSHPGERAALQRHRPAGGQHVFHPPRSFVAAVRQQTVIPHANAQAAGDPPKEHRGNEALPSEHEKGGYCANVKSRHEKSGGPVYRFVKGAIAFEKA